MCDPTGGVATALVVASAGYSAYSSYQQGKAQQDYYSHMGEQNRLQAEAAERAGEQNAAFAQQEGSQEQARLSRDVQSAYGQQKTAMAASGLAAGSASAEDIMGDTYDRSKMDEMAIRYNADMKSWQAKQGAQMQGWDLRNQSTLNRMSGRNAMRAGQMNMTSSLLGGAKSVAGMWAQSDKDTTTKTKKPQGQ